MQHNQPPSGSFPPPPPGGPPPNQGYPHGQYQQPPQGYPPNQQYPQPPQGQGYPPQHLNATPLPDYQPPPGQGYNYNPAHPSFAPPPGQGDYNRPSSSGRDDRKHHGGSSGRPSSSGRGSSHKSSWTDKLAAPFHQLSQMVGSETFLPTTMDKECEKAARILRAFCKDGIYQEAPSTRDSRTPSPSQRPSSRDKDKPPRSPRTRPNRTLLTIPSKVIHNAVGLAIFTTARAGLTHVSGSTGSGVLIARLPDGSWSAPSGIQIHGVGAGLMLGVDIYDCVVVINTKEALRAFMQTRMALGTDLAVSAGPWGAGGSIDVAAPPPTPPRPGQRPPAPGQSQQSQQSYPNQPGPGHPGNMAPTAPDANYQPPRPSQSQQPPRDKSGRPQPVYSYVKSRGFYVGVAVDGTVVTERKDANAAFYGRQVSVQAILHGEVSPPPAARAMLDVVRGAEGWHGQGQGQAQGQWQNQAPGQAPPPQGYYGGSGYDSKADYPQGPSGSGYPQKPPQQGANYGSAASGSAQAAANWKAAEMQEEARRNAAASAASMQSPPPRYTDNTDAATTASTEIGEMPPAYSDDGRNRAGVGDNKSAGGHR